MHRASIKAAAVEIIAGMTITTAVLTEETTIEAIIIISAGRGRTGRERWRKWNGVLGRGIVDLLREEEEGGDYI